MLEYINIVLSPYSLYVIGTRNPKEKTSERHPQLYDLLELQRSLLIICYFLILFPVSPYSCGSVHSSRWMVNF